MHALQERLCTEGHYKCKLCSLYKGTELSLFGAVVIWDVVIVCCVSLDKGKVIQMQDLYVEVKR